MGEVYMIRNIVTGLIYIGQTTRTAKQRFKEHIIAAFKKNSNQNLHKAIREYGVKNFELCVLEDVSDNSILKDREKFFIDKYDTFNNGYNETIGGSGITGYHHTDETKEKMGKSISASMWKINTPERTAKIRNAQIGRKFTEKHKQHIKESIGNRFGCCNPFYGKSHKESTRRLLSDKNSKYCVIQYDLKTGENLNIFDTVRLAAEYCISMNFTTGKISSVMYRIYTTCLGKQSKCYEFGWKYVEKCID